MSKCSNCQYFSNPEERKTKGKVGEIVTVVGECRRYPPATILLSGQAVPVHQSKLKNNNTLVQQFAGMQLHTAHHSQFPKVVSDWVCGEFVPKNGYPAPSKVAKEM